MSSVTRYAELTDEQLRLIHSTCDRFERALRNHDPVSIEDQIAEAPDDILAPLFRELLEIELEAIKLDGDSPDASQYESRFPDRKKEIEHAFSEILDPLAEDSIPVEIGRYQVDRLLGSGGFAHVYLAYDAELKRNVAIKVPRLRLLSRRETANSYLNEAQTLASLDHPSIVPVYDVGRNDEFPCYVVSKYVEGTDLARYLENNRMSWRAAALLIADMADALHHAHTRGFVHRDVKPGNILMDANQQAFLADFGVALKDFNGPGDPGFGGTPAYMSPEQVRGEGHRVDGRSDIYSLGSVFYELLTGRRTFPKTSKMELVAQIAHHDVKPPRQVRDSVPKELERICLKTLSKRARDRYTTALDMAEELRIFLGQDEANTNSSSWFKMPIDAGLGSSSDSLLPASTPVDSDSQPISFTPRGLRAFDEHDSDSYLRLLPGTRDRDGLPDSVRFWKSRIEEVDPDKTFDIGLIYGPSGSGKTSLVKAGIVPRLSKNVTVIFVEATATQTESRLLKGLQKHCEKLHGIPNLKEILAAIRQGNGVLPGQKILIVLDQFEQWLHAKKDEQYTELVDALRQCDGEHLQCVVLVRVDFWLATSRLMQDLEVDLVSGWNIALVDLFDRKHSRKVLKMFGQAFDRLPENSSEFASQDDAFLDRAIEELVSGDKVISVRLALFAEMMKGKPWTAASLEGMGGMEGIGTMFLEETFGGTTANPKHRLHQRAVRDVLKSLLPDTSVDIIGRMRSYSELMEVSGYSNRPSDFEELINILDGEIRLITPADPEGIEDSIDSETASVGTVRNLSIPESSPSQVEKYYQLTHDYLVPSLRDWLNRKQKATLRGRSELLLSERSALWNRKEENRRLPSLTEWGIICVLTNKRNWTVPERRMMRRSDRVHGFRWIAGLLATLILLFSIQQLVSGIRHRNLVERLQTTVETMANSRGAIVPRAIEDLERYPDELVVEELNAKFTDCKDSQKLGLAYALANFGSVDADFLVENIDDAPAIEVNNLATALGHSRDHSLKTIWQRASQCDSEKDWRLKHRLAVVSLYMGDPTVAEEMCALSPTRVQRLKFILGWPSWHGDISLLANDFVDHISSPALVSGICSGIGGIPLEHKTPETLPIWQPILTFWYQNSGDASVHSSSGWLLATWKSDLPEIGKTSEPVSGRDWHVNGAGITMIQIPAGSFSRKMGVGARNPLHPDYLAAPLQRVTLTQSFLMSDREISLGQYKQMLEDPDYPETEKTSNQLYQRTLQRGDAVHSSTDDHPAQWINWNDGVLFCNWLSRKEGFTPCYVRTGRKWTVPAEGSHPGEFDDWQLDPEADGYRLPTDAEWEYVCRAGMTTQNLFEDEENVLLLSAYTSSRRRVYGQDQREDICGLSSPNGWGLFDMHGNVIEWCQDWAERWPGESDDAEAISDPRGPVKNAGLLHRSIRRGIFHRTSMPLMAGATRIGMRVVRTVEQ